MQRLEKNDFHRYRSTLRGLGVSDAEMPHFVKWVRYFLDFKGKYGAGRSLEELVELFEGKLASKGQSPALRRQARRAVEVFLAMSGGESGDGAERAQSVATTVPSGGLEEVTEQVHAESHGRQSWKDVETALLAEIKRLNYSPKTARTYLTWVLRFGQISRKSW